MAQATVVKQDVQIQLTLSELEARALVALLGPLSRAEEAEIMRRLRPEFAGRYLEGEEGLDSVFDTLADTLEGSE